MVLVTGATGKVGRQVVSQLLDAGAEVRALARNPAAAHLPAGAEVVRGDLTDPDMLGGPIGGAEAAFLLWPLPSDAAAAVVGAIARRVRRIVYLSAMSVDDGLERQSDPITQGHADLERLVGGAGVEWTFLRAGGFASNTLGWAEGIRAESVVRAPFGAMARSLIHERDIAAVAVRALIADDLLGSKPILTGPEAVSLVDQARLIGEAIGRPVRFEELTVEAAREQMIESYPFPPAVIDGMLDAWASVVGTPEPVSTAVEEITGAPAHGFGAWARDHAADFA
jgi:uncharacterized protein YbjT (DUF2867 family)